MLKLLAVGLSILAASAHAQPTELDWNFSNTPPVCTETSTAADTCGANIYYSFHGRASFPRLLNNGPVTISISTRTSITDSFILRLPVYVQLNESTYASENGCEWGAGISTVMVAYGAKDCAGLWKTVGPIDLTKHGIPLGASYQIQILGVASSPPPGHRQLRSVGVSRFVVTSPTTLVTQTTWSLVKEMWR